jgi:hypothetical protein
MRHLKKCKRHELFQECLVIRNALFFYSDRASNKRDYINPLKPKLVQIIFKNSVRTSKKTPHFTMTKINWLTLFKFNQFQHQLQ